MQTHIAFGQLFSKVVMKMIQKNQQEVCNIYVRWFDCEENSFMVDEMTPLLYGGIADSYCIDLRAGWYDCGEFKTLYFPCGHVLAACAYIHLYW